MCEIGCADKIVENSIQHIFKTQSQSECFFSSINSLLWQAKDFHRHQRLLSREHGKKLNAFGMST